MNIFILDNDIQKCVEYHCDKHVEILKQIDDAYQEVFRRVAAVEKLYLERFKESRGESKK